jgi:hypothetical protein
LQHLVRRIDFARSHGDGVSVLQAVRGSQGSHELCRLLSEVDAAVLDRSAGSGRSGVRTTMSAARLMVASGSS